MIYCYYYYYWFCCCFISNCWLRNKNFWKNKWPVPPSSLLKSFFKKFPFFVSPPKVPHVHILTKSKQLWFTVKCVCVTSWTGFPRIWSSITSYLLYNFLYSCHSKWCRAVKGARFSCLFSEWWTEINDNLKSIASVWQILMNLDKSQETAKSCPLLLDRFWGRIGGILSTSSCES